LDKPFLKWAGGKTRITARINRNLHKLKEQTSATQLIEPFLGSGAVFLNATSVGFTYYVLCEINEDLIDLYQTVQSDTDGSFIDECEVLFTEKNKEQEEYLKRRKEFNDVKKELQEVTLTPKERNQKIRKKSALFVYMNRHCFNGLCRYNSKGEFNVPFGQYKKVYFPRKEMENFHKKTKDTQKVIFKCIDFEEVLTKLPNEHTLKSVVYADPPYAPLEAQKSNFSTYAKGGFNLEQHEKLANLSQK
jgi:DNA adenine methylase